MLLGADDPGLLPVNQILFTDGTSWDTAEILSRIEGLRVTASATGSFLEGTGFRDALIGAQGNDYLDGRGGADRMVGGAGDDHYWVNDAGDTVVELEGEGTDTVLSQIDYTLPEQVENLFLRTTDLPTTDPVRGEGNTSDNLLLGNFVNNVLIGGAGDDIFWGGFSIGSDYGPGDDDLYGGAGNDSYVVEGDFNGFDTIYDAALPGEGNRLQFGNSFRPEDVLFIHQGSTLRITNGGGANRAILVDFDPSGATGSLVTEVVAFSGGAEDVTGGYETRLLALMNPTLGTDNGEAVMGTSQAEVVKAQGGDDVIEGGAGNDVLLGGTGNDTYVFNRGDGFDLIDDQPGARDINTVHFGAGITQEMLRVSYSGTSSMGALTVRGGTSGDGLHFLRVPSEDPTGPHAVDTFHFADGTQLTFVQLFDREVLVQGTGRSDGELFGTFADDRMLGLSGSEALSSGDGNDTLIGGTGNDVLQGGGGSDTYVFNPGDGLDEILDDPGEQGSFDVNRLRFGTGITASDLILFNAGDGFTVNRVVIGTAGDEILLPNFIDFSPALRAAEFADGVTLDLYHLHAANRRIDNQTIIGGDGAVVLIGGIGNDTILAGNGTTTLLGGAGHDTLTGGAGANLLMGGRGNDLLRGGDGHDTYLFNLADGIDTIRDVAVDGAGNRIQFGYGITRNDLVLNEDQATRTLTIAVGTGGDTIRLTNFDLTGVNGTSVVEILAFADGSTASLVDQLTSTPNHEPTLATPLADQTVLEDAPFSLFVPSNTFADEDAGDVLTLSASLADGIPLPAWLTFDAVTATFTGTPDDAQVGTLDLKVTATDSENLNISDVFMVTVANVNEVPTVAVPLANQTALEDSLFTFAVPGSTFVDVDQVHGDTLTYSAVLAGGGNLPAWLSFDPLTRTFSGTPGNTDVGTLALTVTAIDSGNLSASTGFTLAIQNLNDTPTVAAPIADQKAAEDLAFALTIPTTTFADEDVIHGDVLTYNATLANEGPLPTWLSFNPITRTFSGTPGAGDAGNLQIAVTTTDIGNLSAPDLFTLAISGPLPQTVIGTAGNDVLTGGRGEDTLTGLAGTDTLQGGSGHDLLNGGTGTDTMQGGTGNDTYLVDVAGDVVTELANEGTDTVQTSLLAYTLGTNVEHLILTGTGPSAGFGNALNNGLTGNSGANLLDGKGGADTMTGGGGDDLYIVDHAGDTVVEQTGEGTLDTVSSSVAYTVSANVENLVLTGGAAINGTGNNLNNVLTGNSASNALTGRAGDDTYIIGTGDTVVETSNEGTDTVVSGITHSLAANVENLTLIGFSASNGTGNGLDNVLNGVLNLAGNTLTGGAGNDTYVLGSGDLVVEAANGGADSAQASFSYTLGSHVEHLTLTGTAAINGTGNSLNNTITGNSVHNVLSSAGGADTLRGGLGNDTVNGGSGNDIFQFDRGEGQDLVQDNSGTADKILYDAGINPWDLVISRQANDLRLTIHGSSDRITVQNWYVGTTNRIETIQAGNGQTLLSTQVNQLIQAMAGFTAQTGLTWDQGIDQQPQDVQTVLAANWQG
jgi:Ca2+-binding RTX toxin-like protein